MVSLSARLLVLLGLVAGAPACDLDRGAALPPIERAPPEQPAGAQPVADVTYSEIYQFFLLHRLTPQIKAERWARQYKGRWVRWTGQLVAITANGVLMRHLKTTLTYDVKIVINEPQRSQLHKLARPGRFYTYMARFESYNDVFRSLSFDQGVLLNPTPEGVAGELVPIPPPLLKRPLDHGPRK